MLWLQALVCFCAWIGYGVLLARTNRGKAALPTQRLAPLWGAGALIVGMVVLVGCLYAVAASGGLQSGVLTGWAWIAVLVGGTIFVHLQSVGALILLRSALGRETAVPAKTSVGEKDPS